MCVRGIHFASVYDFSIRFRNCPDSVGIFGFHSIYRKIYKSAK